MTDDKFILMNMDDARSKKVAEVISNPTCKKIVDYLAENKEKSEEDIAKDLGIPINTAEYNLKKLVESGLVEKASNFFWSKRGKKINLYKLANKHIVISPKKRPDMNLLKTLIPVVFIAVVVLILAITLTDNPKQQETSNSLKNFNSLDEITNFLKDNQDSNNFYGGMRTDMAEASLESGTGAPATASADASQKSSASDYSKTNIQVEGVDEADIVKNDGKYIYAVSGNKVVIVEAYPAEEMKVLSEINKTGVANLFINGNRLAIFSYDYKDYSRSVVSIYDVIDRSSPKLENEISVDGDYVTSRMIGDNIYLVANQYAYYNGPVPMLPSISINGAEEKIAATDIAYFPNPDTSYTFTNILALDINTGDHKSKTYLTGASYNIYASEDNIYLTYTKTVSSKTYFEEAINEVFVPLLPALERNKVEEIMNSDKQYYEKSQEVSVIIQEYSEKLKGNEKEEFDSALLKNTNKFNEEFQKKTQKTVIHKINVNNLDITYITNGEVPGYLLNQFSMDEYNGNFRIATTTGESWGSRASSLNHMYILNENLETIGSIEDLAKGEKIYSTRFMGERAYMVTFRQVDPLFVVDLSNPESPEVLGQLKVTGFSNYLHPYDENHIIGIGKEASEDGRVQGLKIALFDVSDVSNPIEQAKYEVKEQWSDSNALYDPKAFLFNKEKQLLVLPVSYNIQTQKADQMGIMRPYYNYWQGAFVFKINENEISLTGKIDHVENATEENNWQAAVQRSLYMDNVLYTFSQSMIKANDLGDLNEISSVNLPYEQQYYGYDYPMPTGGGVVKAEW